MHMADIVKGGWLAGRRKWIGAAVAVAVPLAGYLTGEVDLPGLIKAVALALSGVQ